MRKIVLFKAPKEGGEEEDPYEKVLSTVSCSVCSIPVLSFEFVNVDQLAVALTHVEAYSGIVFTSQRAVEAVQRTSTKIADWLTIRSKWRELPAFVVGQTTASLAKVAGFTALGEVAGNARNLSHVILKRLPRGSKPLLYPCGSLKRETLPSMMEEAGQDMEEVMVYNTCPNPLLEDSIYAYIERQGPPTCIVYFSPSGVRYTHDILQKNGISLLDIQVVAIGPSTEIELEKHKIPVYGTAIKPSPEDLYQVIFKGD